MSNPVRQQAPSPGPERNIAYPQVAEQQLTSGLRVLTIQDERLPCVFVSLVFGAGRASGPSRNTAALPLSVELVKSGTRGRSAREISEQIDRLAIHYESSLQMEHTRFSMTVLLPQLEEAIDILDEIVDQPVFPEEELQKLRVRWKSELIAQRSQPGFLANECTVRTFYGEHPYARVSTLPEDLEQARREDVLGAYRGTYGSSGTHLLMAGAVSPGRAFELAAGRLGTLDGPTSPRLGVPPDPEFEGRRIGLVHRPHSVQSYFLVAGRTLPRAHPEAVELRVANQVLGGGGSARLFLNLREDKGFTYGAYSRLRSLSLDGLFMAGASVRTEVTLQSIQEVLGELRRLGEDPPDGVELERCRQELIGGFIRQMEEAASVGLLELERRLFGLPEDYFETFIPRVRSVRREQVAAIARRCFDPSRVVITVVADREAVESDLRQLGELQVSDVHGNPL